MNDYTIQEIEARARAMRAEAFGQGLRSVGGFVAGAVRSATESLARWGRQRRAYDELMALDDRQLRDMGLSRSDIAAVVTGTHMPETAEPKPIAITGASANANERPAPAIRRVA